MYIVVASYSYFATDVNQTSHYISTTNFARFVTSLPHPLDHIHSFTYVPFQKLELKARTVSSSKTNKVKVSQQWLEFVVTTSTKPVIVGVLYLSIEYFSIHLYDQPLSFLSPIKFGKITLNFGQRPPLSSLLQKFS